MDSHGSKLSHKQKVQLIVSRVQELHKRGVPFWIYHGTSHTTWKVKYDDDTEVDTSRMDDILNINTSECTASVEPNVSMKKLVDATLAKGLVPRVVMELPEITVGGGFAGSSGESSSFRWGLFDRTISEIEIVLADGKLALASNPDCGPGDHNYDLFNAAAGTFGTMGVVTSLKVQLIPSQPYVKLMYCPVGGMNKALDLLDPTCRAETTQPDFLEAIMFSETSCVVISGRLTSELERSLPLSRYTRAIDPWFYLRAQQVGAGKLSNIYEELVPIKDYLFRYDRGAFWTGKYAFEYFVTPFNSLTRFALDRLMRANVMGYAAKKSRLADQYIAQDIAFPFSKAEQAMKRLNTELGIYPLWLCPLKVSEHMSLRPTSMPFGEGDRAHGMMLNIGIYGPHPGRPRFDEFILFTRAVDRIGREEDAIKCHYAVGCESRAEFWQHYDKQRYDRLREDYPSNFDIYKKVTTDCSKRIHRSQQAWRPWLYEALKEQWPIRGVYGVMHAFLNRLVARASK